MQEPLIRDPLYFFSAGFHEHFQNNGDGGAANLCGTAKSETKANNKRRLAFYRVEAALNLSLAYGNYKEDARHVNTIRRECLQPEQCRA